MTKEQALQYAKYAAKKALDELEKQRSVRDFRDVLQFYIIVIAAEVNLEIAKCQLVE